VLVTSDRRDPGGALEGPRVRPRRAEIWVGEAYVEAVRAAGGVPVVVPPGTTALEPLLGIARAVLLTGGHFDIHPSHYGEEVTGRLDRVDSARTTMELALARACLERDLPLLGICGGMQAMAVATGGRLVQDLPAPTPGSPGPIAHEQPTDPATPWHDVHIARPARVWLPARLEVNSTHHQAVEEPAGPWTVAGRSPDGVIELILAAGHRFAVGVQWHPELLGELSLYRALVAAAR